jgi:hypothetical protein
VVYTLGVVWCGGFGGKERSAWFSCLVCFGRVNS